MLKIPESECWYYDGADGYSFCSTNKLHTCTRPNVRDWFCDIIFDTCSNMRRYGEITCKLIRFSVCNVLVYHIVYKLIIYLSKVQIDKRKIIQYKDNTREFPFSFKLRTLTEDKKWLNLISYENYVKNVRVKLVPCNWATVPPLCRHLNIEFSVPRPAFDISCIFKFVWLFFSVFFSPLLYHLPGMTCCHIQLLLLCLFLTCFALFCCYLIVLLYALFLLFFLAFDLFCFCIWFCFVFAFDFATWFEYLFYFV